MIEYLRNIPQPQQRTDDFFHFRHNLLTASSIWKVFGSESIINNIIQKKCKSFELFKNPPLVLIATSLGQKYEPVYHSIYEALYDFRIEDFGLSNIQVSIYMEL